MDMLTPTFPTARNYVSGAAYDATPYPRMAHQTTHPMHLGALATLMGMDPARPSRCRVLDIGCAQGSNILPMALAYPESEFVGIDASEQQIQDGQRDVDAVGATNIRLVNADLLRVGDSLGKFDYIIAHGFLSWVPPQVADGLFAAIKQLLTPQGIAMVSYNVYPGWYLMEGLRNMMLYRVHDVSDPQERIDKAREVLSFVAHANPASASPFGEWVNGFLTYLDISDEFDAPERDAYLLHDQLEAFNRPYFFHQFAASIREHGLQYVCDADIEHDFPQGFPEGTLDHLRTLVHSPEEMQQYMDFARNRMFRRSLITHDDVALSRVLHPARIAQMGFASPLLPAEVESDLTGRTPITFRNQKGLEITTDHPLSKAALQLLSKEWPRVFALRELVRESAASINLQPIDQDVAALCVTLMQGFTSGDNIVNIMLEPPYYTQRASEFPVGSKWARYELQFGPRVTNLRHERVKVDLLEAELVTLLDGTRDVAALTEIFLPLVRAGNIQFADTDVTQLDDTALREVVTEAITRRLMILARAAMLEA